MWIDGVFTKQERAALGFILGVGLLGMAVQLCRLDRDDRHFVPYASAVPVNRAGEAELVALPGIGPVLAKRILEDRELHGRYLTLEDLARVKGVTPKTLARLERWVRFD